MALCGALLCLPTGACRKHRGVEAGGLPFRRGPLAVFWDSYGQGYASARASPPLDAAKLCAETGSQPDACLVIADAVTGLLLFLVACLYTRLRMWLLAFVSALLRGLSFLSLSALAL